MPRREDHPRNLHHARLLLWRGLVALGGLRIGAIALIHWRVRGGRIERRQRLLLAPSATPWLLPTSASPASILRIAALGLTVVALVVLAATRAPLVALVGIASTLLRIALLVAAGATTLPAWRLLLLGATLPALAIRLCWLLIWRSRRIDGVRLAAARLLAPLLATLPARIAATRGIRLRRPLLLRILWLAWLAPLLAALIATTLVGPATTWRIGYRGARAGTLRATARGLLAARRRGLGLTARLTIGALGGRRLWRGRRRLARRAAIR